MPRLGKLLFHYGRPYDDLLDKLFNTLMFMRKSDYWIYYSSIQCSSEIVVDEAFIKRRSWGDYKLGETVIEKYDKYGWFIIEIKKVDKFFKEKAFDEANKLLKALKLDENDEIVLNQLPNKLIISKIDNYVNKLERTSFNIIPISENLYKKYSQLEQPFQIRK